MKLWPLFLAVFVLSSFSGKWINNSLYEEGLKGKVRSITYYADGITADTLHRWKVYWYDTMGNKIADSMYNDDTLFIRTTYDYKYNKRGDKTEENIYNRDGSLSWKTLFDYDDNGVLREARRSHSNGLMEEKYIYLFDNRGFHTEMISYNNAGGLNCITRYKYDTGGMLTELVEDDSGWHSRNRLTCIKRTYTNSGATTEVIEYDDMHQVSLHWQIIGTMPDSHGNYTKQMRISQHFGRGNLSDTILYQRKISYY